MEHGMLSAASPVLCMMQQAQRAPHLAREPWPFNIRPTPPQVSAGWEAGADVGPVISPQAKQRIERLIDSGVKQVGRELGTAG